MVRKYRRHQFTEQRRERRDSGLYLRVVRAAMRATSTPDRAGSARRSGGFTLVELSVALAVALFLLLGLFTMEQSTRQTSDQQTKLAQLQDSERLAMTILTDVIQAGGYFWDPTTNTSAGSLPTAPAPTLFATAGQWVYGVTTAGNDTIYVQFMTGGAPGGVQTDGLYRCDGQQNTTAGPVTYINQFSVSAAGQLQCSVYTNTASVVAPVTAAPVTLVEGLQSMTVLYGVASNAASGNNVDTYMTAAQVTAAGPGAPAGDWIDVSSVQVILTFTNPLATTASGVPVPGQPATIKFRRVIGIMNRMGLKS
jgi:type IV pilus assembly protein PilW